MTLITPETIPNTPAILFAVDPWQPLFPEAIDVIRAELDALQANPVQGWDEVYPTLFNAIQSRITVISEQLKMPTVPFIVYFAGGFYHQAAATTASDGTKLVHLGAAFLRKFLLCKYPEQTAKNYDAFMWVLAHELGHLRDPLHKIYAKTTALWQWTPILVWLGVIKFFAPLPTLSMQLLLGGACLPCLQILGIPFVAFRRRMEYNADAAAISVVPTFDPENIRAALFSMKFNVEKQIREEQLARVQIADTSTRFFQRIFIAVKAGFIKLQTTQIIRQSRLLHPAIEKRSSRMINLFAAKR